MSAKSDFIIPAFLNKDKSSKVQAVNIVNDEHIKEFMSTPSEDEVIIFEDLDKSEEDLPWYQQHNKFVKPYNDNITDPDENTFHSSNKWLTEDVTSVKENKISEAQLKDVARMARALRPEEIVTVLDNIPINYIYDKIGQELEKNRKFTEAIMQATDIINKD